MSHLEFAAHFHRMESLLLSFAMRLTKDENDARDLFQETAYKAFKYRKKYRPHTNLQAWLITIMRNTFINDYRKKKRRNTLNYATNNYYFLNAGGSPVLNDGESKMTVEELKVMIDQVEEWARIPFLLYYQGFKYEEIAEEMDIPIGTVKSRIFYTRKCLREMIRRNYG
jgi:RNA polymerase sigma-70 factor (ECF subfamily)